jgi:hypothetical protein
MFTFAVTDSAIILSYLKTGLGDVEAPAGRVTVKRTRTFESVLPVF